MAKLKWNCPQDVFPYAADLIRALAEMDERPYTRDELRYEEFISLLKALPGFPQDLSPEDILEVEPIKPIISLPN